MMPNIDDLALFSKQKINFHPSSTVVQFVACNNIIVICTDNGKLLRIPLQEQEKQIEIDVTTNPSERFEFIHLDPTGQHLLISLSSGEVLYFHPTMKRPKPLTKMKGNLITAVAWNSEYCKDHTTGFILVGTSKGLLFETEILHTGALSYFNQVWCLTDDVTKLNAVMGVFMHRCDADAKRWLAFVTTAGQLFPFIGTIGNPADGSVLQGIFQNGNGAGRSLSLMTPSVAPNEKQKRFTSQLHLYPPWADSTLSYVAWMEIPGIQHGNIDQTASDPYKIFTNQKLYSYPMTNGAHEKPLGIVLTEYHVLILYEERVTAVCTLNEQIVYEDNLGKKFGKPVGITRDPISGVIWVFTTNSILRYKTNDETRYLWSVFLEMGDYIQARKFAANNPQNLDVVLRRQAVKLLEEKNYSAAAEMFALTQAPFEEISLKFIQADDRGSLKIYLQKKLDSLEPSEKAKTCVLVVWLLEIFLVELGDAKVGVSTRAKQATLDEGVTKESTSSSVDTAQRYKHIRQQFAVFLKRPDVKECMEANHVAIMRMMSSHGDMESLLYFSEMIRDFETVLTLYIQQQHYDEALAVLGKQANPKLFYKFSPDMIPCVPSKLVDAWISAGMLLKPIYLLPALYRCQEERLAHEAIRYLEHCISKMDVTDVSVHNLLLAMYVNYESPERLMRYLESQGQDSSLVKYDVKYALRLCLQKNLHHAAVHIYCTMGLFEEAVNLALKINIDLAKRCAGLPVDNYELKRKLWLCVARHVVAKEQDIKRCMDLLQESDGLIKIQDLLPFFPDFVTIDHFKDSLCECLMERSGKIQALQEEMKEAIDVSEQIKKQIKISRNKYSIIRNQDKCSSCNTAVITRGFYCFPCRHNFHADCLENECLLLMTNDHRHRVKQLRRQLANMQQMAASTAESASVASQSLKNAPSGNRLEKNPQLELDELLASECLFCGSLTIRAIDHPFFTPQEYIQEQKNWD